MEDKDKVEIPVCLCVFVGWFDLSSPFVQFLKRNKRLNELVDDIVAVAVAVAVDVDVAVVPEEGSLFDVSFSLL